MKKNIIHLSRSDRIFNVVNYLINIIIFLIILYPMVFILSSSFSSTKAVTEGRVFLLPVDLSLDGYKAVFGQKDVFTGYINTIYYTVLGTIINVSMTMIAAYPLSRSDTPMRGAFTFLFTFTMFFSGGLIPTYVTVSNLGLINSRFALLLPGAIGVWNMIITRTFIQNSIPNELLEASSIDGCGDAKYFFKIVLPLSRPILAVIALYYAVGHWNAYFDAMIYLNDRKLFPLQIFLREVLILNSIELETLYDEEMMEARQGLADLLKYSLIVVSVAPMLILYPFVQKFFIKGVMIGSLKG